LGLRLNVVAFGGKHDDLMPNFDEALGDVLKQAPSWSLRAAKKAIYQQDAHSVTTMENLRN